MYIMPLKLHLTYSLVQFCLGNILISEASFCDVHVDPC